MRTPRPINQTIGTLRCIAPQQPMAGLTTDLKATAQLQDAHPTSPRQPNKLSTMILHRTAFQGMASLAFC
jgi:hypothetical protein